MRKETIYLYVCDYVDCKFKTNNYEDFGRHHLGHLGIRELKKEVPSFTYNCGHPGCGFGCENNNDFSKHLDTHLTLKENTNPQMMYPYNCVHPGCGFGCNDQQDFLLHQKKHDLPFGKPISVEQDSYRYTCASPDCAFQTDDARHFDDHMKEHKQPWKQCDSFPVSMTKPSASTHPDPKETPLPTPEQFNEMFPDGMDRTVIWPRKDSILIDALTVVKNRRDNYGGPQENFKNIATMWSVILKREVTLTEVGLCMIALKTCRHMHKPNRDNLVDIAGYADCVDVVERKTDEKMV